MRVTLINQFYPPDTAPTGQLLADLAGHLGACGHNVHVVCSRGAYGGGSIRQAVDVEGVTVHRVGATAFGRGNLPGRLCDYASFMLLARRKAMQLPADVCVALTTPPTVGQIALRLKQKRGTRLMLWVMDLYPQVAAAYGYLEPGGWTYRRMAAKARRIYDAADAVVALGDVMRQRLIEAGAPADRIRVVHNWVPGEAVAPMSPEQSPLRKQYSPDGKAVVLYSGNLGLGHELDTAVTAAAALANDVPLRLAFVGHGKARAGLRKRVDRERLQNVSFHPPQPLSRLSENLAAGDVHLVSQHDGTQGLIVPSKLYGVLAARRPVVFIGPRDCEPAQIIADADCGIIVPNGDADAVATAFRTLAADAELRETMGARALSCYRQQFTRDRGVAALTEQLEGIA